MVLALLVELASEAVVRGPPDDALFVQGGDDAVRLLVDEGDAVHVVREVDESPLQLLSAVLLLRVSCVATGVDAPSEWCHWRRVFSSRGYFLEL